MMHWWRFCKIKMVITSALPLIITKGISFECDAFKVPKLLISFSTSSWVTFRKDNTSLFILSLMLRILGWALYFLFAFKTASKTSFVSTKIVYFCQFSRCFLYSQNLIEGIRNLFCIRYYFTIISKYHSVSSNYFVWEI